MKIALLGLVALMLLVPLVIAIAKPARTILPLYAATLPGGSAFVLPLPLPTHFNSLTSLLGALAILAIAAHLMIYGRGRVPRLPVGVWLGFFAWLMMTIYWARDPQSATALVTVASPLIALMLLVGILPVSSGDLDVMRVAIIAGGIIVGSYALFLLATGAPFPLHASTERFTITNEEGTGDPNILAASLLLPLALSIERLVFGGSRWWRARTWRLLGLAGAGLCCLAILVTGSRGGILSAVVTVGLALFFCARLPEGRAMVFRVVRATVAGAVVFGVSFAVVQRFLPQNPVASLVARASIQRLTDTEDKGSGRLDIWSTGYLVCQRYCAWGVGFASFEDAFTESVAFTAGARNRGLARPAHNIYLELAVEAGLIGATLFAIALIAEWIGLSNAKARYISPAMRAALVGLLVSNIFLGTLWFKYFWLVFIMLRLVEGAAAASDRVRASPEAAVLVERRLEPA